MWTLTKVRSLAANYRAPIWLKPSKYILQLMAPIMGIAALIGMSSIGTAEHPWQEEFSIARQGRFVFVDAYIADEATRLLVDTGSTRTGLDQRFKPQLGEATGQQKTAAFGRPVDVTLHRAPQIRLGNLQIILTNEVYSRDFSAERTVLAENFWGTIGEDALRNFVVQFDFDAGVMRLATTMPDEIAATLGTKLQLKSNDNGRTTVEGIIGDERPKFLISTGSNTTCLQSDLFDALRRAGKLEAGREKNVIVPAGLTQSQTGLLREPRIGPHIHDEIVCDRDTYSSLGLRYLSRYIVTIDYPNHCLYLQPGETYQRKARRGFTGISAIKDQDSFVVTRIQPGSPAEVAGIQRGDRILKIDDQTTADLDMFQMGLMLTTTPGARLEVTISRNGRPRHVSLIEQDRFSELASSKE